MASTLQVGQILRASVWSQDTEQASVNVLHYRVQAVGGLPATDADFATAFDQTIATAYRAAINNNATYRGVEAQVIWPLPVLVAVNSIVGAGVGTGGAIALPRQSAALTQWRTSIAGRHGHGRSYWPFPPTIFNQLDGSITAGGLGVFQTLHNLVLNFGSFTIALRNATMALVVYDRVSHVGTLVNAATTSNKWATQRRRGTYGRQNSSPI